MLWYIYAVCKCARRLNPSQIHIKEVGFAKLQGVFCEFDVRRVQIGFAMDQVFFLIKLPSIECVSILLKFRWSFVDIHKDRGLFFVKLPSMDCGLISPKVQGFFAKFTSSDHPCVRSEKACIWQSSYVSMLWYMQCVNVRGDLTRHQYTLSGLVLQKSWVFSVDLLFVECKLISPKLIGFYVERRRQSAG